MPSIFILSALCLIESTHNPPYSPSPSLEDNMGNLRATEKSLARRHLDRRPTGEAQQLTNERLGARPPLAVRCRSVNRLRPAPGAAGTTLGREKDLS